MCNVKIGSEDSIFRLEYILKCYDFKRDFTCVKESKDSLIILAADFAISPGPKADFDAYVIIEKRKNFFIIKHIEIWKGIPTPSKVERIDELIKEFQVDIIVADESNIGRDAIEDLMVKGHYVIPKKFTGGDMGTRKQYLIALKRIIESRRLVIPRCPDNENTIDLTNQLTTQLTGFVERKSEKTSHKLLDSTAMHDDIAMSLAMAIEEGTLQVTDSFFDKVEKLEKPPLINPFVPKH